MRSVRNVESVGFVVRIITQSSVFVEHTREGSAKVTIMSRTVRGHHYLMSYL